MGPPPVLPDEELVEDPCSNRNTYIHKGGPSENTTLEVTHKVGKYSHHHKCENLISEPDPAPCIINLSAFTEAKVLNN